MLMDPQKVYIRYKEYIEELHAKDEKQQHSLPKEEVQMSMHDVGRKFLKEEIVKTLKVTGYVKVSMEYNVPIRYWN